MKAMKGLSMNKMLGSIKRKTGGSTPPSPNRGSQDLDGPISSAATPADNPVATAHNSVKAFCESGGSAQSDEVLFLPPIVDAAESSPAAAAECARVIRKYLAKDYYSQPSWQYNALMLVRILTDHPGQTFTRNLDDKFTDAVKALLKHGKDPGVRHLLMEMLDDFEFTKMHDANLGPLVHMWKKEKDKVAGPGVRDGGVVLVTRKLTLNAKGRMPPIATRPSFGSPAQQPGGGAQNYFARSHTNNKLPNAVELASRLEEARTSAKLLEQVVMNTPPADMLNNDLIREFANRCLSASRSIQGYMTSESPAPDNDTMESLIDTNEQLQTALNQHQRAVLSARKQFGPAASPSDEDGPPAPVVPMASGAAGGAYVSGAIVGGAHASGAMGGGAQASGAGAGAHASGSSNAKGKQAEVYSPPEGAPPRPPRPGPARGRSGESAADGAEDPFADDQAAAAKGEATKGGGNWVEAPRHAPPQPPVPPPPVPAGDDEDLYGATPKSKRSMPRF